MRRLYFWLFAIAACAPAVASAQSARTFVSSNGSDSNSCSRQAPCRSFATAITKTAAGGEINTLDPGGYGPVTITKSISIVSGLGEAGVLVPAGGTGITINAGPDDAINLRGLVIEGAGVGATGLRLNSAGSLTLTNCVVRGLTDVNVDLEPTGTTSLLMTDTLLSDGRIGLYLYPENPNAFIRGALSRVSISNNAWGIYGNGYRSLQDEFRINLTVADSVIANNRKNPGYGIFVEAAHTNVLFHPRIAINGTTLSNNNIGVFVAWGVVHVSRSIILGNSDAYQCQNSIKLYSYHDNTGQGNGACIVTADPQ